MSSGSLILTKVCEGEGVWRGGGVEGVTFLVTFSPLARAMRQSSPIPGKEATPPEGHGTPAEFKAKVMQSFDCGESGGRLDWSYAHKELLQHTGYDLREKYEMRCVGMGVWVCGGVGVWDMGVWRCGSMGMGVWVWEMWRYGV